MIFSTLSKSRNSHTNSSSEHAFSHRHDFFISMILSCQHDHRTCTTAATTALELLLLLLLLLLLPLLLLRLLRRRLLLLLYLIRHRARACEARVWRDRFCRRLCGYLGLASMPWMDWSFINFRAARPICHNPPHVSETTFSASNFGFKIGRLSKPQNPAKIAQKAPKILPKTPPKRLRNHILCCKPRKSKIMQPSHVFAHF